MLGLSLSTLNLWWMLVIHWIVEALHFSEELFQLFSDTRCIYNTVIEWIYFCFIGRIATGDLNFTSAQPVPPPLVPHPPQRSELQPEPNLRRQVYLPISSVTRLKLVVTSDTRDREHLVVRLIGRIVGEVVVGVEVVGRPHARERRVRGGRCAHCCVAGFTT
jgi:hypothetical protein